ncbi:tRNA (N6-isopentenyl adenosine(37)-C2)-methylthiotransferase MiaB [Candidatus Gracilibacteria bacterium]|nr:tRNA (N6-isopentenyl adenosine(37)-C2)-methylthiotransferase MiaB [Candidatus Gracilibacteria bacterium]
MNYFVQTFGCQMNYSDSERVETYLQALGFNKSASLSEADLIMFNTCSIRQKAEDKVYGHMRQIRELKKDRPDILVAITGCMVRTSSSKYSSKRDQLFGRSRELDIALRIEELPKLAGLMREINPQTDFKPIPEESLEDYFKITPTHDSHNSKAQAFVAISNGCDKFCTYCIVPYSRGREKSRRLEDILSECQTLVQNGCKEITLIGQTVNSYGLGTYDKNEGHFDHLEGREPFVHLLHELDKLKDQGLVRLRFTSPHPKDMSDQLIDALATLPTQMPYLHLPVQAGDDTTLRRMNRSYTTEQYRQIVQKLRAKIPDIAISTDIIVGFCGESEEEFQNTYDFFKEIAFEHAYLARYSERTGTTAAKFIKDDIPEETKAARWHKLNDLLKEISHDGLSRFIGQTVEVLVESQENETCLGRSPHFKTVQFSSGRPLLGQIVPVKITGVQPWLLEGELV